MSVLNFDKLENAYITTYENAKELIEEAEILYESKKYARAYFLAQIAYEEIAKLPIIFQEASRAYFKETHDWKVFYMRLRNHLSKNKMNLASETFYGFSKAKLSDIENRIEMMNRLKNGSLYSDLDGKQFIKPSDVFKKEGANSRIQATVFLEFYTDANYHVKGNMKKWLNTDKGKKG
ncbi:AbiV family abortive infection protein [Terribacillus saccharophilus]|uniref:AbiV family abortive infection protein n=1 Tax=Terribacillus saccharophilus TaxID=361277 RepID=UPI00381D5C49